MGVTEPLTVRPTRLREAADDLRAVASRLGVVIDGFAVPAVDVDSGWRADRALRRVEAATIEHLTALRHGLDAAAVALTAAASAYLTVDDRARNRMRAVPW